MSRVKFQQLEALVSEKKKTKQGYIENKNKTPRRRRDGNREP
jgi:hypothetical protein